MTNAKSAQNEKKKACANWFVHKKEGSCNFFSADHHGCITSQVRTCFSPSIWEEIDLSYFEQCPILEVPIDISLHDKGTDMRAYRHADSGAILLEMNLYDYENEKPDFSKSAFREFNEDIQEREYTEAAYDITAKTDFMLMGMDDCGRWCNGFIYVPTGTGFVCSFDKGFYPKGYRGPQTPIAWPMIHLTNSQIGIEIMFPAKYANDVFDFSREIRVNIARRSMTGMVQVKCKKCGRSILQPINASDSVYVDPGFDFSAQHHGKKYWIGEFLCDECYERVFKCEQKTWFYQREKESAPYM